MPSLRAILITFVLIVLSIPASLLLAIFWDDLENKFWPIRYGYSLEIAVEVDRKPYSGSATYECTYLRFYEPEDNPVCKSEGDALAFKLENGRVLIAPIIYDGYCALQRREFWNWKKHSGKLSARYAAWKAVAEGRKLDALETGQVEGIFVLDSADSPKTLQSVDWQMPERALDSPARLLRFDVRATSSPMSTNLSEQLPWIRGKSPRDIRLENRWLSWHVRSFNFADRAAEIEGWGVPLPIGQNQVRYEDVI